jgi:diguanylate cyclase (GGDEF)-like protein/PAS domain S-box-containing protein
VTSNADARNPSLRVGAEEEAREGHLSAERLERVLGSLLRQHPEAPVAAFSSAGLFVAMPPTLEAKLERNPVLKGRSGLDGVSAQDRESLLANWDRVLKLGVGRCVFQPPGHPHAITMYGLDLREEHGVIFSVLVGRELDATRPAQAEKGAGAPPRIATMHKNDISIITEIDEATSRLLGWSAAEMSGRRSLEFVHPEDHAEAIDNWMEMLAHPGLARSVRQRVRCKDDHWAWFAVTNHNLLEDPAHGCVLTEMVDISEEVATHEALRAREQLLDQLAEAVPVGLFHFDARGRVLYANDRLREIFGTDTAATIAEQFASVVAADHPALEQAVARVLLDGSPADLEVALCAPGRSEPVYCTIGLRALTHEDGGVSGAIACVADVTDSTRMREELRHRASVDELTGCQNRAAIMAALQANIASGQRRAERAVLFVDLDGFKQVNDEHGHAAGDELLRCVAERLRAAVREGDLVGRFGGDEFLIVCPEIGGADAAAGLAARVTELLRADEALAVGAREASIGIAWSTGSALSAEALVDRADRAMYEVKRERGRRAASKQSELAA